MSNYRDIHCVACGGEVQARYTSGEEIYPRRADLWSLSFWKCDGCNNFVGTHRKQKGIRKPLGSIPTPELRATRRRVHSYLDPMWMDGRIKRKDLYNWLSDQLGYDYHTATLNSEEEADKVTRLAIRLSKNLKNAGR